MPGQQIGRLTKKQRALLEEIKGVVDLEGLGYDDIGTIDSTWRTPHLERVRDHLIRSVIVLDYTLIDEHLSALVCGYFFGREKSFIALWKTKKFRNFNYYILEKLYMLQKLELARAIQKGVPKSIANAIRKLNDLRNGLAHSFFPDNRRQELPTYDGHSVYTPEGFTAYRSEIGRINDYLVHRLYGKGR